MRHIILSTLIAAAALGLAGCKEKTESEKAADAIKDAQKSLTKSADKLGEAAKSAAKDAEKQIGSVDASATVDKLKKDLAEKIEELDKNIKNVSKALDASTGDAKKKLELQLDGLKSQRSALQNVLDDLKKNGSKSLTDAQAAIKKALN